MIRPTTEHVNRLTIRVYYEDTDFSGVVYHASYLRFLERGRTELLRAAGIEQATMTDDAGRPIAFAVRHMAIDFLQPARMDDLVEVDTRLDGCGGASLDLAQAIVRGAELLVRAQVKVAIVGAGRARRLPRCLATCLGFAAGAEPPAPPGFHKTVANRA